MKIDQAFFFFLGMKIDQQASVAFRAADAPSLDTILTVRNVLRNGCQPHQRHFNRPRWQNRYISPLLTTLAHLLLPIAYRLLPTCYCHPRVEGLVGRRLLKTRWLRRLEYQDVTTSNIGNLSFLGFFKNGGRCVPTCVRAIS